MKPFKLRSVAVTLLLILMLVDCKGSFQPSIANAGLDQTLIDSNGDGSETVILDGSKSYDPDGKIISYSWTIDNIILGNLPIITIDFGLGTYVVTLYVTNNDGLVDEDTTIITVVEPIPLKPPTGVKAVFDEERNAAKICWEASVTSNVSYAVYRSSHSRGSYRQIATGVKGTCYMDFGAREVKGNFYYVVASLDETGQESQCSNEAVLMAPFFGKQPPNPLF